MGSSSDIVRTTPAALQRVDARVVIDPASPNVRWAFADDESAELSFGKSHGETALFDFPAEPAAVATALA